ncbi:MAG: tRNA (adenosine(37)-N6)-threonylcarbamoyltransferase complex ATPase subunit type 1 TsaE [Candidatus Omnitrophica bacterium]|nr:tRNA (adenosine(37)-N6)-threonylcarbamoyltransferase complex ATPase subunit type 1 TsaE [Candidatus Omnitrophota bacterium]
MERKSCLKSEDLGTSKEIKFISNSYLETINLGRKISRYLKGGEIICLFGEMGAGKTTLIYGIAQGLGIKKEYIISPSFVFLRQYRGEKILNHFDLYRLKSTEEICDLGYEEFFYSEAITVIEWAEKLGSLLPKEFLRIILEHLSENKRIIRISGVGQNYEELARKLKDLRLRR